MDTYHFCRLGHRYLANSDYLAAKTWVGPTGLYTSFINLTGTNVCVSLKIFPEVAECWASGIPCWRILWLWLLWHILLIWPHTSPCDSKLLFCSHGHWVYCMPCDLACYCFYLTLFLLLYFSLFFLFFCLLHNSVSLVSVWSFHYVLFFYDFLWKCSDIWCHTVWFCMWCSPVMMCAAFYCLFFCLELVFWSNVFLILWYCLCYHFYVFLWVFLSEMY